MRYRAKLTREEHNQPHSQLRIAGLEKPHCCKIAESATDETAQCVDGSSFPRHTSCPELHRVQAQRLDVCASMRSLYIEGSMPTSGVHPLQPRMTKLLRRASLEEARTSSPVWDACHTHAAERDCRCQHVAHFRLIQTVDYGARKSMTAACVSTSAFFPNSPSSNTGGTSNQAQGDCATEQDCVCWNVHAKKAFASVMTVTDQEYKLQPVECRSKC
jgi:hypothetical protein